MSPNRPLRIVLNAVAVKGGGGRTFLVNILQALCALEPRHEYLVVVSPQQRALAASFPAGVRVLECASVPRASWLRLVWEQTVLPILLLKWRADLLWSAFNTAVLLSPVPVVLVSQSISAYSRLPIRWGRYMQARLAALRVFGRLSAWRASVVVFVSETSARVMSGPLGVPKERVRVVPYGWRPPEAAVPYGNHLPARFVLTVGDLMEHKNIELLLDAFARLVDDGSYDGDLVVAGGTLEASSSYEARLRAQRDGLRCAGRIHFVGAVPVEAMPSLYRAAGLFVLPSLEETFGMPLVEAMGFGVPVVASDWSLSEKRDDVVNPGPEICGIAAEYFDPTDSTSLQAAMRRVLVSPERRASMVAEGLTRARHFSWNRSADSFARIFEEAVRARPVGRSAKDSRST